MKIQTALFLASSLAAASLHAAADTITLGGTVRDFLYIGTSSSSPALTGHPDFERIIATDPGIVKTDLGADGRPVYDSANVNPTITSEERFDQFFHDTSGVNLSAPHSITLTETSPGSGTYSYIDGAFFPIDDILGGNQGNSHNYHFTFQLHTTFTYQPGQDFAFSGDDDVFVFINDKLVIDLGGVHGSQDAAVDLDTLGLTVGDEYDFDFFFAERHTTGSNLKITTSIVLDATPTGVPDAGATLTYLGLSLAGLAALKKRVVR